MPKQIFNWFPDVGASLSIKPAVETTKFGDGYELRTDFTINGMPDKWSMSFSRSTLEAKAILAFLKAHGAKLSFEWKSPHEETGLFVCREWAANRLDGGVMRITCSFEQVFEA